MHDSNGSVVSTVLFGYIGLDVVNPQLPVFTEPVSYACPLTLLRPCLMARCAWKSVPFATLSLLGDVCLVP